MDKPSLIAAVMPTTALIALFTGIALPFSAALRKARSPETSAEDAPAGYLYVPCVRTRHHGYQAGTRRWVQEVPIVKKTAKLIYYASDSWDRRQAVVSPGCISREQFETDTLCHDGCPAGTRGVRCAKHGYTWERCPHDEDPCRHGYPAGVIPIPGYHHRPGPAGRLFFASREAAEAALYCWGRERAGRAAPDAPDAPPIRELRRAMADAHPDRGGSAEQFIAARRRYETARQAEAA